MKRREVPLKQYEFRVRCTIVKLITVEATSEAKAVAAMNEWDAIDEREIEQEDWKIISGHKESS